MRRLPAYVLIAALIIGFLPPAAQAGSATNAALGLASFAAFSQLVGPLFHPWPAHAAHVFTPYPVVYTTHPVYAVPYQVMVAPPPQATVIQYPHGRYELRGDGVTTPYQWVWIPNPPPAPPPPTSP